MAATSQFMDSIFAKYGVHDKASFDSKNAEDLIQIRRDTYRYAFGMLGCILLILALWWLLRKKKDLHTAV